MGRARWGGSPCPRVTQTWGYVLVFHYGLHDLEQVSVSLSLSFPIFKMDKNSKPTRRAVVINESERMHEEVLSKCESMAQIRDVIILNIRGMNISPQRAWG